MGIKFGRDPLYFLIIKHANRYVHSALPISKFRKLSHSLFSYQWQQGILGFQ